MTRPDDASMALAEHEDKRIPADLASERAVIGALLTDPASARAPALLHLEPRHFYFHSNSVIFAHMQRLAADGKNHDAVAVAAELRQHPSGKNITMLEKIGGAEYIADCACVPAAAANLAHYCSIIFKCYHCRSIVKIGGEIAQLGYFPQGRAAAVLFNDAVSMLNQAARELSGVSEIPFIADIARQSWEKFQALIDDKSAADLGPPTGFDALDYLIGSLAPGDLITIAAATSVGKTTFAANIAYNILQRPRKIKKEDGQVADIQNGILYFSLEMDKHQILCRLFGLATNYPSAFYLRGHLPGGLPVPDEVVCAFADALEKLEKKYPPFRVVDSSAQTIETIRAQSYQVAQECRDSAQPLSVIIVDYLQLIEGANPQRDGNRNQEIGSIMRGLKKLASELNVPVIALSQLNRAKDARANKAPHLSDLRDSGSIEQDSDIVLFLERQGKDNPNADPKEAQIHIAKARNSATTGGNPIQIGFRAEIPSFINL